MRGTSWKCVLKNIKHILSLYNTWYESKSNGIQVKTYLKKLFFFDFEYAGMDDPAKLISDFICQPDYRLNKNQSFFF